MTEFKSNGFDGSKSSKNLFTMENIQKLDYLNYVVKEGIRIDGPGIESLNYEAYEDLVICGVPISKGSILKVDFVASHMSRKEWQDPRAFIPERFDPESELFTKPDSGGKSRTPYSHIGFGHGNRSCPGQSFGLLETKVLLTYLLTHLDFNITKKIE